MALLALVETGHALETLCNRIGADEAGDDDRRGNAKPFALLAALEIDRLNRLLTCQLLDLKRVAIYTAWHNSVIGLGSG